MEEKKSRRPGLQTTVRRIPGEAVKTTKNNRAAQLSKESVSGKNDRRNAASADKKFIRKKTATVEKQAEKLTEASARASKELQNAIRFSVPETMRNQIPAFSGKTSEEPEVSPDAETDQNAPEEKASVGHSENSVQPEPETKPEEQKSSDIPGEQTRDASAKLSGNSGSANDRVLSGLKNLAGSGKHLTHRLWKAGKVLTKKEAKDDKEQRQKKVYKQRLIIMAALLVLVLFLVSCIYHVFHFQNRTVVNGVDVSGLSIQDAAKKMESQSKYYSLTVTGEGGVKEELIDSVLNVKVEDTSGLKKVMRKQNPFNWIIGGLKQKTYTADIRTSYDEDRLEEDIATMSILQEENMTEPVDATLTTTDDGHYQIEKETIGSTFDVDKASDLIADAVGNYQRTVDISASQKLPSVYSDSENLTARMNEWNTYLESAGISYNFPAETVTLDSKDLSDLLADDGETVTVSYTKVAVLMADWRETYDTYNNSFEFTTHSGETVKTWYEGDYGYELDEEGTAKDLIANIEAGDNGNHDPKWFHEGNSMDNMGLGDTYVEVSIEDQHLWVYKDGEVVVETDVVTGNPNPDDDGKNRETYKGCYAIKGKYEDVTLGTIEVQGYASPVNYWVPFNGGEGLHDAPWRDEFGGTIYETNGSHGCVNCPEDMMGKIYANVEVGEAVIIY